MLFDVQAALAEILAEPAPQPAPALECAQAAQVSETSSPAKVLPFAPPSDPPASRIDLGLIGTSTPTPSRDDDPFRHRASVTGLPRA